MGRFLRRTWRSQRQRGVEIKRQNFVAFVKSPVTWLRTAGKDPKDRQERRDDQRDMPKDLGARVRGGKRTGLVLSVERLAISLGIAIIELISPLKKMMTPRKESSIVVVMVVVSHSGIRRPQKPIRIVTQRTTIAKWEICLQRSKRTLMESTLKITYLLCTMTH